VEDQWRAEDYLPLYGFSFNRIGFLVGALSQSDSMSLTDVDVTVFRGLPEPASALIGLMAIFAGWTVRGRATCPGRSR
jgi:hypothetical protein